MMRLIFSVLIACLVLVRAPLRATTFESAETQASLIELYTSEGCSSCPPAETRLTKLRDNPGLWTQFVPVAFHVDYWDNLGWADRFASGVFTRRQYSYAARWGGASVYTPEFVLNGHEGTEPSAAARPGRLRVDVKPDGTVAVTFQPTVSPNEGFIVEVAPLASGVSSDVRRGENSGRHLAHDFVALDLVHAPLEAHDGGWSATLKLPAKTVAPVSALAAWVHAVNDPVALQATGGWLKS